jgi:ABC-type nitrate/sulfonate/bicarbonate transport system substrate-binding protein
MGGAGVKLDPGMFVSAGGIASRLAAVINGGTSATMVIPPEDLRAAKAGLVDFGINVGRTPPRQFVVWITNKTWARQNRDTVARMLQGLKEALHWLNDPANRQEAAEIFTSFANVSKDAALHAYDVLVTSTRSYSQDGEFNEAGIQNVLKDIAGAGEIREAIPPVTKYIDTSYLR